MSIHDVTVLPNAQVCFYYRLKDNFAAGKSLHCEAETNATDFEKSHQILERQKGQLNHAGSCFD